MRNTAETSLRALLYTGGKKFPFSFGFVIQFFAKRVELSLASSHLVREVRGLILILICLKILSKCRVLRK